MKLIVFCMSLMLIMTYVHASDESQDPGSGAEREASTEPGHERSSRPRRWTEIYTEQSRQQIASHLEQLRLAKSANKNPEAQHCDQSQKPE